MNPLDPWAGIEVKREPESVDRFPTSQGDLKDSSVTTDTSKLPLYAPCNYAWYASDFKCWYYQIPLAEVLWPYFSFQHEGRLYYITRLPMGFSASVAIGNTISKIIVRETMRRSRYSEIGEYHGFHLFTSRKRATWSSNVGTTTQVDNVFIFSGDPEIACNFELVTNEAGVLRSESSRQSHGDILGMHYVKTRLRTTVQLTTKYLTKHTKFLTAIVQKIPTWVFWRAAALILRGLAVLQESLSFFYGFMFEIRKVASKIFQNQSVGIPRSK